MSPEKRREEVQVLDPKELSIRINDKFFNPEKCIDLREFVANHEWDVYEHLGFSSKQP